MKTRLLVADDDRDHQRLMLLALAAAVEGLDIRLAADATEFLSLVRSEHFDCIVLDFNLGEHRADDLIAQAGADIVGTPVIVVSSSREQRVAIASFQRGVANFVPKEQAISGAGLWNAIKAALAAEQTQAQDRRRARRREEALIRMTETDPLTSLMNRRGLEHVIESARTRRDDRLSTACIMIDIDHFKQINDTHGHAAGDKVLCQVADLLKHCADASDRAARWGGEEFVLIQTSASVATAWSWAERFRRTVEGTTFDVGPAKLRITLSAGVAVVPTRELSLDSINLADHAMYLAKDTGRNRVATWDMVRFRRLAETIGGQEGTPEQRRRRFLRDAAPTLAAGQIEHITNHCEAVASVAEAAARRLGLVPEIVERVRLSALVHDIGKCAVPESLISKAGPLTADEAWMMQLHAREGAAIADALGMHPDVVSGVQHHHRWHVRTPDDEEYRLGGGRIAEIVSAADAMVAMTTTRPYRDSIAVSEAAARLYDAGERQFAPGAARAAIEELQHREAKAAA